jgi:hypothetical protein
MRDGGIAPDGVVLHDDQPAVGLEQIDQPGENRL